MSNNLKLLFWTDSFLLHYCLAHTIQQKTNHEIYGIFDVPNRLKSFFNNSTCNVATARAGNCIGGGDWTKFRIRTDSMHAFLNYRKLGLAMVIILFHKYTFF